LAKQLLILDEDRALLQRLGERARAKALSDFDERSVIQKTMDVYDELLQPAKTTPDGGFKEIPVG
jgi:glycosyltransferase involved in cell wall biosynthesis